MDRADGLDTGGAGYRPKVISRGGDSRAIEMPNERLDRAVGILGTSGRPGLALGLGLLGLLLIGLGFLEFILPILNAGADIDAIMRAMMLAVLLWVIGAFLILAAIAYKAKGLLARAGVAGGLGQRYMGVEGRQESDRARSEEIMQRASRDFLAPPPQVALPAITVIDRGDHYEARAWVGTDDWSQVRWHAEGRAVMVETSLTSSATVSQRDGASLAFTERTERWSRMSTTVPGSFNPVSTKVDLIGGWLTISLQKV